MTNTTNILLSSIIRLLLVMSFVIRFSANAQAYYSENAQATDESFAGCFKGDCENGSGTYIFASGSKYEGDFKDGQMHGRGIFFYTNGDKYEGGFKDDWKHGKGTYIWASGEKREGEWIAIEQPSNEPQISLAYKASLRDKPIPVQRSSSEILSGLKTAAGIAAGAIVGYVLYKKVFGDSISSDSTSNSYQASPSYSSSSSPPTSSTDNYKCYSQCDELYDSLFDQCKQMPNIEGGGLGLGFDHVDSPRYKCKQKAKEAKNDCNYRCM